MFKKKYFAVITLTIASLCLLPFSSATGKEKPNIILIIGDDISWNDFGCYGNKGIKTPNIDRLASEGLKFTNAYLTASSCSPSRTSIITGRYPHNTGEAAELHGRLPYHLSLFPKVLKEAGYYTAHAGKWHIGSNEAYYTADMPAIEAFHITGSTTGTKEDNQFGGERNWVQRLQERPNDKPFFMWFASLDAHRAWGADSALYMNPPENIVVPPYLADTPLTRKDLSSYYNEVTRLDFYVGKVMEELDKQELSNNTIVIFMADNGRPFPRSKTRVYDSGMKTPLIVWWPGGMKTKGETCNSLVSSIDIAPTLLEIAGTEIPSDIQGISFRKLLDNPEDHTRKYTFSEQNWHDFEAHVRQMRWKNFMYIRNARPELSMIGPADAINSPSGRELFRKLKEGDITPAQADYFLSPRPSEELYNCENDPHQLVNLASDPKYQDILNQMREVMNEWQDQTGDDVPEKLTPDWFVRINKNSEKWAAQENKNFNLRGTFPGKKRGADYINAKGPY